MRNKSDVLTKLGVPIQVGDRVTVDPMKFSEEELLRTLRNASRTAFFTTALISRTAHERWIETYGRDTSRTIFTIYHNDIPVGFISVTNIGSVMIDNLDAFNVYELGHLLIDAKYRRLRIMSRAINLIRERYHRRSFWVAHVKPTNAASLGVFERADFWRLP